MSNPTLVANSPIAGSIAWSSFTIQYKGNFYAISASSTSVLYSYWILSDPLNVQFSATPPVLGPDDTLLFINRNGTPINVIDDDYIDGALVSPGTLDAGVLSPGSIVTSLISPQAVTTPLLQDGSVTHAKLATSSVDQTNLVADSVTTTAIAANSVTASKIPDGSITSAKITTLPIAQVTGGTLASGVVITGGLTANNASRVTFDANGLRLISRNNTGADSVLGELNTNGTITFKSPSLSGTKLDLSTNIDPLGRCDAVSDDFAGTPLAHGLAFGNLSGTVGIRGPMAVGGNFGGLDFITGGVAWTSIDQNGHVSVLGDLSIRGQSVARGLLAYTRNDNANGTPGNGAETASLWFDSTITIVTGRKYLLRWAGTLFRSDGQTDVAIMRFRSNTSAAGTTSGPILSATNHLVPASFLGNTFSKEIIFQGGSGTNVSPGINGYVTLAAGNYSFTLSVQKSTGNTNSATLSIGGIVTLQDIGT
jgi:hypothetical protein